MQKTFDMLKLDRIIRPAKRVARRYREITGKPLGITGEVGEVQAARLLGLDLADARQAGYDAVTPDGRRVQIKARCVLPDTKLNQRVSAIRLDHEWDSVALILMNQDFEPLEIFEAERGAVERELLRPARGPETNAVPSPSASSKPSAREYHQPLMAKIGAVMP